MKVFKCFDLLCSLVAISIVVPIFSSQIAFANNSVDSTNLSAELQTHIYYWAFNGKTSKDPEVQKELLEAVAGLSESLGLGEYLVAKSLLEKDVQAQGGPQVLLSSKVSSLLKAGIEKGQYASVNRFLNSLGRLNPQLAEVSSTFVDHYRNLPVNIGPNLYVASESRANCLQSCVSDFLGLKNNQTFQYMTGRQSKLPSDSRQLQSEKTQIGRLFPNDSEMSKSFISNTTNARTAFGSDQKNHCVGVCMKEISSEIQGWMTTLAGVGVILSGPSGAVGGAVAGIGVGGAVGLGICMTGPECSRMSAREQRVKEKEIELKEREQRLRENEIRLKEEQQLQQERQRRAAEEAANKAKVEAAKQQREEAENKKRSEEESRKKREEIEKGDWHDRSKNKDAKNDSSASCEATKSCDGTMNATIIPEYMREDKHSKPLKDGHGNILEALDLSGKPMQKDFSKKDKGIEPKKIIFDNRPLEWVPNEAKILSDGAGKVITNFEMTSTPMPSRN